MKERSPLTWMKRFNARVRYHSTWAKSGRLVSVSMSMFSRPMDALFVLKYKFACHFQLPVSAVCLVAENLYISYAEDSARKNKNFCGTFDGFICYGADITSQGICKLKDTAESSQLCLLPAMRLYAVDRQSFKAPVESFFCPIIGWSGRVAQSSQGLKSFKKPHDTLFNQRYSGLNAGEINGVYLEIIKEDDKLSESEKLSKFSQISIMYLE